MQVLFNTPLGPFTSFNCGGNADTLIICENSQEHIDTLLKVNGQLWNLGFGTNSLISDDGLPGSVVMTRGGSMAIEGDNIIVDSGAWWDDVVLYSIKNNLWGLELMSGIPSSIGGAIAGNIAAYGQQIKDCLQNLEIFNVKSKESYTLPASKIDFGYRESSLQQQPHLVITKAVFKLSKDETTKLQYDSALKVAEELKVTPDSLLNRRKIILETRRRAGSLYNPDDINKEHTAGSFFKNPVTDVETAKKIATFDETGKSLERILNQNLIHSGDSTRVSAAHVLLAAGFKRGQRWGKVRLHPEYVLKIENTGDATALDIYKVAQEIINTVEKKLHITLEPEVNLLGNFHQT